MNRTHSSYHDACRWQNAWYAACSTVSVLRRKFSAALRRSGSFHWMSGPKSTNSRGNLGATQVRRASDNLASKSCRGSASSDFRQTQKNTGTASRRARLDRVVTPAKRPAPRPSGNPQSGGPRRLVLQFHMAREGKWDAIMPLDRGKLKLGYLRWK